MGLHVFLHVGLLGKGSATHNALEGLLPCVTEGRRHRISSWQREEAAPGQGPWWGRQPVLSSAVSTGENAEEFNCLLPELWLCKSSPCRRWAWFMVC